LVQAKERAGNPLVLGHATRARTISAAFLAGFNDHFYDEGHGIFAKIYKDHPVEYFWGLITLAKVMKVEIGGPHEFDRPSTKEEALDRLERTAGPHARQMLEQFLQQVKEAEAKYHPRHSVGSV
jgi:hypothetical protein